MAEKNEQLEKVRHSMSHVMAAAVLEMFPDAQIAIGPSIENGFYYDFDLPRSLTPEDLEEITERMKTLIKGKHPFERQVVSRDEAAKLFNEQKYKIELLEAIPEGEDVSLYSVGPFTDLCRGPHVESTSALNAESFKLLSIAGAYWRGDEKNAMLQRIYGTAWKNPKDLRIYLQHLEDVEKRDHRRLGKELDLYSTHEEAGPGARVLASQGGPDSPGHRGLLEEAALRRGIRAALYAPRRQSLAVGNLGAPGFLQREHVRPHGA